MSVESLWDSIVEVRQGIVRLKELEGQLTDVLVEEMKDKTHTMDNGVTLKRSRALSRKWDGPALIGDVARRSAETALRGSYSGDPLPEPLPEILGAVVQNLRAALAVSYGRMGELDKIGLDPDEYSTKSWGAWRVQVVPENNTSVILDEAKKDE